ncbi:Ras1 guanine nucleotide exchange factor [Pseudoloma neurophilia]|uniref:Ras1 guanine nucleotide exchange factor n=1 Tax=Pseudoloma neurophilia TaxID=146866 RepID=A0A0R0M3D1_9MICR|nr:Ras1 guanine nucleotide exchange factor [Pseudoloma neurophilia]
MLHNWEKWLFENFDLPKIKIKDKIFQTEVKHRPDLVKKAITWDETVFPESNILLSIKNQFKDSSILYERYDTLNNLDVNEVADTLHQIDLKLYKKILPTELVEYGKNKNSMTDRKVKSSLHFQHILTKNKALSRLTHTNLQSGMKIQFFERVCRKLKRKNNFNSIAAIINGIRVYDDTYSEADEFNFAFNSSKATENSDALILLPFETILSDIALSNQNPQSEEANMFFYGIIRFFIQLQDITPNVDDYLEHGLLKEMLSAIQTTKPSKHRKIKIGCSKFF